MRNLIRCHHSYFFLLGRRRSYQLSIFSCGRTASNRSTFFSSLCFYVPFIPSYTSMEWFFRKHFPLFHGLTTEFLWSSSHSSSERERAGSVTRSNLPRSSQFLFLAGWVSFILAFIIFHDCAIGEKQSSSKQKKGVRLLNTRQSIGHFLYVLCASPFAIPVFNWNLL